MRTLTLAVLMIAAAAGAAAGWYYYVGAQESEAQAGPPTLEEGLGSGDETAYVEAMRDWMPVENDLPYGYVARQDQVDDNRSAAAENPCLDGGAAALEQAGRVTGMTRTLVLADTSLAGPHQPLIIVSKVDLFRTAEQAQSWLFREESACRTNVEHSFEDARGVGEVARAIRLTFNNDGANGYAVAFRSGPVLGLVFGVNAKGGEVSPDLVRALAKDLEGRIRDGLKR